MDKFVVHSPVNMDYGQSALPIPNFPTAKQKPGAFRVDNDKTVTNTPIAISIFKFNKCQKTKQLSSETM